MKYSRIFYITILISGVMGIPTYLLHEELSAPDVFIAAFFVGIILYSIPVGIVVYILSRRSFKKKTELEFLKASEDKEKAEAKEKELGEEKREKVEKEIIALKEDVEKNVQKYSKELKTKVETLEKEALSLIEEVHTELQILDDLESRHEQIGKIVKSRTKEDFDSENIKEIKNLLERFN